MLKDKPTLLIFGATSQLSLNIIASFYESFDFVLVTRRPHLFNSTFSTAYLDSFTITSISRLISFYNPDFVLNTIALADVDACERDPERAFTINTTYADSIARSCSLAGIPYLFISTDQLYAHSAESFIETEPVSPVNVYARTKYKAEQLILQSWPESLVVRTNFFGNAPYFRTSYPDYIISSLQQGRPLQVSPHIFFSPVTTETLARASIHLLLTGHRGVFNISSSNCISKYHFACELSSAYNLSTNLIIRDSSTSSTRRSPCMCLSNSKAQQSLPFQIGDTHYNINQYIEQSYRLQGLINLIAPPGNLT